MNMNISLEKFIYKFITILKSISEYHRYDKNYNEDESINIINISILK